MNVLMNGKTKPAQEFCTGFVVRPGGLEPSTLCSEDRCSIQLSYGRVSANLLPRLTLVNAPGILVLVRIMRR